MNYREIKVFSLSRARYHFTVRAQGTVLRGLGLLYFIFAKAVNNKNFLSFSFSELLRSEMSKCQDKVLG